MNALVCCYPPLICLLSDNKNDSSCAFLEQKYDTRF